MKKTDANVHPCTHPTRSGIVRCRLNLASIVAGTVVVSAVFTAVFHGLHIAKTSPLSPSTIALMDCQIHSVFFFEIGFVFMLWIFEPFECCALPRMSNRLNGIGVVNLCLIPEEAIDLPVILQHAEDVVSKHGHVVIVVAEGAGEEICAVNKSGNRMLPPMCSAFHTNLHHDHLPAA